MRVDEGEQEVEEEEVEEEEEEEEEDSDDDFEVKGKRKKAKTAAKPGALRDAAFVTPASIGASCHAAGVSRSFAQCHLCCGREMLTLLWGTVRCTIRTAAQAVYRTSV